jgi:hypothetical protein
MRIAKNVVQGSSIAGERGGGRGLEQDRLTQYQLSGRRRHLCSPVPSHLQTAGRHSQRAFESTVALMFRVQSHNAASYLWKVAMALPNRAREASSMPCVVVVGQKGDCRSNGFLWCVKKGSRKFAAGSEFFKEVYSEEDGPCASLVGGGVLTAARPLASLPVCQPASSHPCRNAD